MIEKKELTTGRKAALGLKLGLSIGVTLGIGHLVWFLLTEHYQPAEIRYTIFNLAASSLNTVTFWTLIISAAFILVWFFYPRLEGLCLAAFIAGLVFLPIAYVINKNYLPGFREIKSLVGNGMIAVTALAFAFLILRWTRDATFIHRFARTSIFVGAVVVLFASNAALRLQPVHQRLQSAPSDPQKLIAFLDAKRMALDKTDGGGAVVPLESTKQYFEKKFAARQPELRKRIAQLDSAKIIAHADSILMRRFAFVGVSKILPEKILWRNNPTNDFVWLFNLNRQEWLWDLVAAYVLTGDEKYARDFELILSDWFEQNPMMNWKDESDPVWRLIDSSLRLTATWLDALTVFFPSDMISDDLKWKMLAAIHDHAQFLMHFRSPGRNHLMQETFGLMAAAAVLPEFKMSQRWLSIAKLRLDRVLTEEIYPDGGYNELSTFYHRYVIRILQQIADFAAGNDVKLTELFYERLQQMYSFLM
ncbi:MAG TPA: heparinase II/III family protein, partial [bacterium]